MATILNKGPWCNKLSQLYYTLEAIYSKTDTTYVLKIGVIMRRKWIRQL